MNIHPLFVHFPIGLLVLYILLELLPAKYTSKISSIQSIKVFLLLAGTVALYPTLLTGGIAAKMVGETDLIELHEIFASLTTITFTILALGYAFRLCTRAGLIAKLAVRHPMLESVMHLAHKVKHMILMPGVRRSLAGLGLVLLFITGALGASVAYGPDFDPIISFVYNIFF